MLVVILKNSTNLSSVLRLTTFGQMMHLQHFVEALHLKWQRLLERVSWLFKGFFFFLIFQFSKTENHWCIYKSTFETANCRLILKS